MDITDTPFTDSLSLRYQYESWQITFNWHQGNNQNILLDCFNKAELLVWLIHQFDWFQLAAFKKLIPNQRTEYELWIELTSLVTLIIFRIWNALQVLIKLMALIKQLNFSLGDIRDEWIWTSFASRSSLKFSSTDAEMSLSSLLFFYFIYENDLASTDALSIPKNENKTLPLI